MARVEQNLERLGLLNDDVELIAESAMRAHTWWDGKPFDAVSQRQTLELAFKVLESAVSSRTTVQSPQRWSASHEWKLDYANIERVSPTELTRLKQEFDKVKEVAQSVRDKELAAAKKQSVAHDKSVDVAKAK
jgi:hypothetical protein